MPGSEADKKVADITTESTPHAPSQALGHNVLSSSNGLEADHAPPHNPDAGDHPPKVRMSDLDFAGEAGRRLCEDIVMVLTGMIPLEQASSPQLSLNPDGTLNIEVSDATVALLEGEAEVEVSEPDES